MSTEEEALARELHAAWYRAFIPPILGGKEEDNFFIHEEGWLAVARLVLDREAALKAMLEEMVREVRNEAEHWRDTAVTYSPGASREILARRLIGIADRASKEAP